MADSTANAGTSNEGGQNQAAAGSDKTFTQEEVNALLAKQKREMNAKYGLITSQIVTAPKLFVCAEGVKRRLITSQIVTAPKPYIANI